MNIHPASVLVILSASQSLLAQEPAVADPLRDTVRGAIAWIARQAVPVRGVDGAVLFPMSEGGKQTQTNVYGGSAGVLIFLENGRAVRSPRAAPTTTST